MDAGVLGLSLFIKLAGSGCGFGSHSPEQAAEPVITRDFSKLEPPEAASIISRFGYGKLGGRKAGSGRSLCQQNLDKSGARGNYRGGWKL